MHSFFINKKKNDFFLIEGKDLHHLKNVIKLKVNEEIFCIYNEEKYLCQILEITSKYCQVKIIQKLVVRTNKVSINLFAGIIREQKWNIVLQKATELGVNMIVPVVFNRSVVVIDDKKQESKIKRWQAICNEAAKQSKLVLIPEVKNIVSDLNELYKYQSDLKIIAWEEETKSLKEQLKKDFKTINIIVGPEGGITSFEVNKLKELGYSSVGLGHNILRAETASLFLISVINYEKNQ